MSTYKTIIMSAIGLFPLIAFLITLPYFIYNYHKYGSISKYRMLLIYGFVLYLITSYFLVILPLPSFDYVKNLTTAKCQLIPFHFIIDFIKDSGINLRDVSSYLMSIKSPSFYQPLFNIVLTIPFGIYLNYYYKYSLKKTLFLTFLLSLFFELTQLTGLYFIYPRGYRLFDVDDLIFNTLGGVVGFYLTSFLSFLPSRDKIDDDSYKLSDKVTSIRRLTAIFIDTTIANFLTLIILIILLVAGFQIEVSSLIIIFLIINFILYIIVPLFKKSTLGKMVVNLKIEGKWYQVLIRFILEYIYIFLMPSAIVYLTFKDQSSSFLLILIYFLLIFISSIRLLLNKELLYGKITKTKNINTLKKSFTTN